MLKIYNVSYKEDNMNAILCDISLTLIYLCLNFGGLIYKPLTLYSKLNIFNITKNDNIHRNFRKLFFVARGQLQF